MKKLMTILIGLLVVVVFLLYMVSFQVRYDQVAVLTTFDRADDPTTSDRNSGSVYREPGIYLKAPWPIQNVHTYSRKLQLLEDELSEMQTQDGHSVIVKTFLIWRVEDPIAFFRSLERVANAEKQQLRPMMGNLEGIISRYRFDEMVNTNLDRLKLAEIEQRCGEFLRENLAGSGLDFGIAIERVGIRRLMLPEDVTEKVFVRMRTARQRMAAKARHEGEAEATTIRSSAENAKNTILAFADRRAAEIVAQGEAEAASYYPAFKADPDFAIFLKKMEVLENILPYRTKFILDSGDLDLTRLLEAVPSLTPAPQPGR